MSRSDNNPLITVKANSSVTLSGSEFIRVQTITAGQKLKVQTSNGDSFYIGLSQKKHFEVMPKTIILENETGVDIEARILFGNGDFDDQEIAGTVALQTPTGLTSSADVNATNATSLLIGANASRKAVLLCNVGGIDTRIGDSNVGATRGHLLKADGVVVLETEAAIYGYAASNNAVSILEVEE